MTHGRNHLHFGDQLATKATRPLPDHAVQHDVDVLAADPEALRCGFACYRALDATTAQNHERATRELPLPVLANGGADNPGAAVGATMRPVADDPRCLVLPECGHHPAEEAPEAMLSALADLLASYRTR
ncbi:alpha/beta hydrolase [Streptomyces sp. AC563]|uniref:alpha/beta fold hydrolase n=1 Tax=Streptomyces buecherae TaxID=2763006 RepID=UPI00164D9D4E|nr:alpha/beta hydrolase [Streptomyces buecherae]MBC3990587.1 alpha/beta hydrolase [Streptomyces buecherae]